MPILSDDEVPYSADINENPGMSGVIDNQINTNLNVIEFQREFKLQYTKYDSLGFNIFHAYSYLEIPIEVVEDFLEYVHVHIITIPDYDIPNLSLSKKEFLVKALYEILFIDIPTKYISAMTSDNSMVIREILLHMYDLETDILSKMTKKITWAQLKAHFAKDLFDSNLDDFVDAYLIPVRNKMDA